MPAFASQFAKDELLTAVGKFSLPSGNRSARIDPGVFLVFVHLFLSDTSLAKPSKGLKEKSFMENERLSAALEYTARGFSVVPVDMWKRPLIRWGEYQERRLFFL